MSIPSQLEGRVARVEVSLEYMRRELDATRIAAENAKIAADGAKMEAINARTAADAALAAISSFRDPVQWRLVAAGIVGSGILFTSVYWLAR